jgi:hypothetical protein
LKYNNLKEPEEEDTSQQTIEFQQK